MSKMRYVAPLLLLLAASLSLAEAPPRDPLTANETDQLREVADQPPKKIKLMVQFAKARLLAIAQMRADPKFAADRPTQMHDLLEDFTAIVDELGDNLEMFDRHHDDLRKPLKEFIEATADFQLKLRAIKEDASPAAVKEASEYEFAVTNALEAVNSNAETARAMLEDQIAAEKERKEKEQQEKKEKKSRK